MSERNNFPSSSDIPDEPRSPHDENQASPALTPLGAPSTSDPFRRSILKRCKELEGLSLGLTKILSVLEFHAVDWEEAKDVHLLVAMAQAELDGIVRRIYLGPMWSLLTDTED